MITETIQMLAYAMHRHGATADQLPIAFGKNKPYNVRGPHAKHPCTLWVGECRENYLWTVELLFHMCEEYVVRFSKSQVGSDNLEIVSKASSLIPELGRRTDFANCATNHKHVLDVHEAYKLEMHMKWDKAKGSKYEPKWYGEPFFTGWP